MHAQRKVIDHSRDWMISGENDAQLLLLQSNSSPHSVVSIQYLVQRLIVNPQTTKMDPIRFVLFLSDMVN
jgi:hypothetical protein